MRKIHRNAPFLLNSEHNNHLLCHIRLRCSVFHHAKVILHHAELKIGPPVSASADSKYPLQSLRQCDTHVQSDQPQLQLSAGFLPSVWTEPVLCGRAGHTMLQHPHRPLLTPTKKPFRVSTSSPRLCYHVALGNLLGLISCHQNVSAFSEHEGKETGCGVGGGVQREGVGGR